MLVSCTRELTEGWIDPDLADNPVKTSCERPRTDCYLSAHVEIVAHICTVIVPKLPSLTAGVCPHGIERQSHTSKRNLEGGGAQAGALRASDCGRLRSLRESWRGTAALISYSHFGMDGYLLWPKPDGLIDGLLQFTRGAWTDAPGRRAFVQEFDSSTSCRFPVDKTSEFGYTG
jgi:hypothetical protein